MKKENSLLWGISVASR